MKKLSGIFPSRLLPFRTLFSSSFIISKEWTMVMDDDGRRRRRKDSNNWMTLSFSSHVTPYQWFSQGSPSPHLSRLRQSVDPVLLKKERRAWTARGSTRSRRLLFAFGLDGRNVKRDENDKPWGSGVVVSQTWSTEARRATKRQQDAKREDPFTLFILSFSCAVKMNAE